MLEGVSYGETWPQTVSKYELRYMDGEQRDLVKLRKTVGWPS